ncbi:MAG: hypothetical protein ABJA98_01395 [Acidobacteriota bacterium]
MVTEIQPARDGASESWGGRAPFAEQTAHGQMIAGLMIMGVGMALVLGRFGIVETRGVWHLWPLLLIGLGLGNLMTPRPDGSRHGGGQLLIGVWLLLNELHIWRASDSWPLFLVAFGIKTVWTAVHGARATPGVGL